MCSGLKDSSHFFFQVQNTQICEVLALDTRDSFFNKKRRNIKISFYEYSKTFKKESQSWAKNYFPSKKEYLPTSSSESSCKTTFWIWANAWCTYKYKYVDASNLHLFLADFLLKVFAIYIFHHKLYIGYEVRIFLKLTNLKGLIFGSLKATVFRSSALGQQRQKNEIVSESSLVNFLSKLLDTQSYSSNYCIRVIICSVAVLHTISPTASIII